MDIEPRAVPIIAVVAQRYWYCLDCGAERLTDLAVQSHWIAEHSDGSVRPEAGVDYAIGSQLLTMQIRRNEWIDMLARRFYDAMHERFGPEDFVAEAEIRD